MDELTSLVERAQARDDRAYGELVHRFQEMAYGYAYAILRDFHLAEDAAQEAFVEAYRCLPGLEHPLAFPAWLKCIVFKHCDRLTRGQRLSTIALEVAGEVAARTGAPCASTPNTNASTRKSGGASARCTGPCGTSRGGD